MPPLQTLGQVAVVAVDTRLAAAMRVVVQVELDI
jgi:hypothetical protein